ncbi:ATP-binding protein [Mycoplasma sp. Pen4]|uniref:Mbov_0397 family ICE element conjugal transfer ATPase n=1 Tax=Mycoplasma sp. Pen4 TaxID=640330 RepID=UPI0016546B03|nr:ATP-binding protein [Mycoplasma sp. Pen4]QNM93321.1 ATP-binding protein [Mycoplasma sp. Pen4]
MLQAKPLKRNQFKIFRNMSWFDMIVFLIFALSDFIICFFGFPHLNIAYRVLISVMFIPLIMSLFLTVKDTSYKVYQMLWIWIKYESSKKKFKDDEINDLMVFTEIDNDGVLATNKLSKNKEFYARLLKLHGNSIFKYDKYNQEQLLEELTKGISTIKTPINIIKINSKNDFKENIFYADEALKKFKDKKSQIYLNALKSDLELFENQKYQVYYILVYGESETALIENTQNVKTAFENVNFLIEEQDQIQTLLFYSNFYDLDKSQPEIELKTLNARTDRVNIREILDINSIEFSSNNFKVNDKYHSMQGIKEFDYEVDNGWLNTIYDSDSNVFISISPLSQTVAEKLLESSNRKIGAQAYERTQHFLRDKKNQYEYEIFNQLTENIVKNQTKPLLDVGVYLLNTALKENDLNEIEKVNESNAKKENIKLGKFNFEQFKCWNQSQIPPTDFLNTSIQALPELIAFGWPWNLELLNDHNNFILGTQKNDGSPVFFDLFHRDGYRRNSNAIIIGTSGSGKSTFSMKLLNYMHYAKSQIIIIDPQDEYVDLCKNVSGQYIDIKNDSKTIINPLEIQINKVNSDNTTVFNIIDNHIDFVSKWFQILFESISNTEKILIKTALKTLYIKWNFYHQKTIKDLKRQKNWPIIDDFIKELENTQFNNELEKEIYQKPLIKLVKEFKFFFQEQISNKNIFNKPSNINLDNKFIVFNVKKLLAQQNQGSAQAQIYLLLNIINTKIYMNSINNSKNNTILFIDEAHFALKDNTPVIREFIIDTTKTIRKYNGSIVLATQNVNDISQNAAKILGNIQYSFFFNCKQLDIDSIKALYETNQTLTDQDLKFISNAKTGECLMLLTEKKHYQIKANYNNLEKDLFFKDFTIIEKYTKSLKFEITALFKKLSDSELKDELLTEYNKEIAMFESNLSLYSKNQEFLSFLVAFKENLIKVIRNI